MKPTKIQEWIHEIEERPATAPFIVRRLAERLAELDEVNESLRSEILTLRSGQKVQQFEKRISELEYQIELLKRQVRGSTPIHAASEVLMLVANSSGKCLTITINIGDLLSGRPVTHVKGLDTQTAGELMLSVVEPHDELLFLFDSGRVSTVQAQEMASHPADDADWSDAQPLEMRSGEHLACVLPITDAPFCDLCIQVSRRGSARGIPGDYFQTFLGNHSLGRGVKSRLDQVLNLALCQSEDVYIVITRAGYLSTYRAGQISITLEEIIKLDIQDYLVAAFRIRPQQTLVIALADGELHTQPNAWRDPQEADGSKRRLILSKGKAGGVQVVGAAAVQESGWAFLLHADGDISTHLITKPLPGSKVSLPGNLAGQKPAVIAFAAWEASSSAPSAKPEG